MGIWMFGYGSLMWKIDFPTVRRINGYVEGFYRTMEWADEVHRGVPGQTSRTAAIFKSDDNNERVWGVAYEIAQDYWDRVLEAKMGYRERGGYNTVDVQFHQFDSTARPVKDKIIVTLFLGDKGKVQYKPGTIDELAQQIVRSVGASGTNLEYLYQTAESMRMILPPGETDKHLFDLEAACLALEAQEKQKHSVLPDAVHLEEKYEKRRELLSKIYRAIDQDVNRQIDRREFQDLAANTLNLNLSPSSMDEKFDEIDKDKNGKLSMKEFIDYFLETTQENEKKFKEEYGNFGMQPPGVGDSNFENAILLYETMSKVKSDLRTKGGISSLGEMLKENKNIVERLRIRTRPNAREVLEFFFPETIGGAMDLWFGKSQEGDALIKKKFGVRVEQALAGELDEWITSPTDCLALIILLNQFTRNVYRDTDKMFAGDEKAQGVVMKAIFYGYWKSLTPLQNVFLPCMVLSTSENLHHQELAVETWVNYIQSKLPPDDPLRIVRDMFKRNYQTILNNGRFPHRNKILARESTEKEREMLKDKAIHFDKPLIFKDNGCLDREAVPAEKEKSAWPDLDFSTKIQSFQLG